jgi:hypothetical protein
MGKHGKYRPLVKLVALLLALWPVAATSACRQALSLGLDVSGSVDKHEYALQMNGLANALLAADVQRAFLAVPDEPVRLHIYVWAGLGGPRTILQWVEIGDAADLLAAAEVLQGTYRWRFSPETALGNALLFGADALKWQVGCSRLTLDISGDGKSNAGARPDDVRNSIELSGVTVNGLIVGQNQVFHGNGHETKLVDLTWYYQTQVIRGSGAFVVLAQDFADFERAMIEKLLKELQTMIVSDAGEIWQ